MALPIRLAQGTQAIPVLGGENLFAVASRYLGDATQWPRIWALNYPGQAPDFVVPGPGTLQIPSINPSAGR